MYVGGVAQITIYVPDNLAEAVKRSEMNISRTCQKALHRELRLQQRRAAGITGATARIDRQRAARQAS